MVRKFVIDKAKDTPLHKFANTLCMAVISCVRTFVCSFEWFSAFYIWYSSILPLFSCLDLTSQSSQMESMFPCTLSLYFVIYSSLATSYHNHYRIETPHHETPKCVYTSCLHLTSFTSLVTKLRISFCLNPLDSLIIPTLFHLHLVPDPSITN